MIKESAKVLALFSAIFIITPAIADYPVAVGDRAVFHPIQKFIKIDVLSNDVGEGLKIVEVNQWSENGARLRGGVSNTPENKDRSIVYEAPDDYDHMGEDGFWYVIEDVQGRRNSARVSVDVKSISSPLPAPQADFANVPQGTSVRIDVLKNDLFSTGDYGFNLSSRGNITGFNEWSKHGGRVEKVEVYSDAGFSEFQSSVQSILASQRFHLKYTPKPGFFGIDSFWYVVEDSIADQVGTNPQPAKVTINVLQSKIIEAPYPVANVDKRRYQCFPQSQCLLVGDSVLNNDIGENLILKVDSAWSLNGGTVQIIPNHPNPPYIRYKNGFLSGIKDKIWYVIEDAYGRQNWSVIEID